MKTKPLGTAATLEQRLRSALAGTSDAAPRPVANLELPLGADRLLTPKLVDRLKPAAVLVPVVRRPAGLTVLFTRRSDTVRSHKGQISFPGGRCEPDDASLAAAALREAQEEIGLAPELVEVCGYLDDYPTITGYRVTPVVGLLDPPGALRPDAREVAEVFEVPLQFLVDPASFERRSFLRNGLSVPVFHLHHGGYEIWGATAGMLWNLAGKFTA